MLVGIHISNEIQYTLNIEATNFRKYSRRTLLYITVKHIQLYIFYLFFLKLERTKFMFSS